MKRKTEDMQTEREIEIFQDNVFTDGPLATWFLGQLSDNELLDRLKYLKMQAQTSAEEALREDRATAYEEFEDIS